MFDHAGTKDKVEASFQKWGSQHISPNEADAAIFSNRAGGIEVNGGDHAPRTGQGLAVAPETASQVQNPLSPEEDPLLDQFFHHLLALEKLKSKVILARSQSISGQLE